MAATILGRFFVVKSHAYSNKKVYTVAKVGNIPNLNT